MSAKDFLARRFGVYILGAGFSKPAGLPLATELWAEIRRRSEFAQGRAGEHFREDIEDYLAYRKACDGVDLSADQIQFEDLLGFLDVEHFLGLRGKDTWSVHGNETQVLVKTLIGAILTERTPPTDRIPKLYLDFAKLLKPPDIVLSFNYDVLLERALDAVGVPYRLFPDRYLSVNKYGAVVDDAREEVIVLKMHGSIDWFDRTQYDQVYASG